MKYHIKKTIGAGIFYLSPKTRRWIPEKSTKHKFGKFSKDDAESFIEAKKIENPDTLYELVPVIPPGRIPGKMKKS